jgi:hypothetical protein
VTVILNDVPAFAASAGGMMIEVTHFLKMGKNAVTFEAVPTCLVQESGKPGPLQIYVASGQVEVDTVVLEVPPLSAFDLDAKRNPKPITRAQAFRAK